jgi:Transaldolase
MTPSSVTWPSWVPARRLPIFTVTTDDVRAACDVLAPVYQQTAARDGRVSIEVDPRLARDAAATADMARALRSAVDRDNMFVKIPATPEGLTAITQVTSEGSASM